MSRIVRVMLKGVPAKPCLGARLAAVAIALAIGVEGLPASSPLADESDRAAFRQWFALLADLQFEHAATEITDCAALVRFAYREALRPHTPEWARRIGLPMTPIYPDVRSGPRPNKDGWPLFRIGDGDLLYYRQTGQRQPDHLMIFVGRSIFDRQNGDWIVYHTGPDADSPGEVRKLRLFDLSRHPSPHWRPVSANPHFVGVFRLALL